MTVISALERMGECYLRYSYPSGGAVFTFPFTATAAVLVHPKVRRQGVSSRG
jgi:hypothetical protein